MVGEIKSGNIILSVDELILLVPQLEEKKYYKILWSINGIEIVENDEPAKGFVSKKKLISSLINTL